MLNALKAHHETKIKALRVLPARTLPRDRVISSEGEELGKIEELIIDSEIGQITHAVMSLDSELGMGDKRFAIPWQSLTMSETDNRFILNTNRKMLKKILLWL